MTENKEVIRFAINLGNAVLATERPGGRPDGITVEIANRIAAALTCTPKFMVYPAAGKVVADALNDMWDVAFLAIDPKREEILRFTQPYITIHGTLLVKAESRWQSVAQMDQPGVIINVGYGAAYDLYLTRTLKNATLNRLASSQEAIDAFLNGEGDMAAGIRQPIEQAAAKNTDFRALPDNFGQINQAICSPLHCNELHEKITELLTQWQQDGSIQNVLNQHLAEQ